MLVENQVLTSNYQLKEGSFLYSLLEEASFNEIAFWNYYNAVIEIIDQTKDKQLDRELTKIIHWTYKRVMRSFLCHFDPSDVFKISDFPDDRFIYFYERLDFMIDGYYEGFIMSEKQFGDNIKNPKYPELY
ncbi:Imm41 family immunity protein [Paenibacillus sp. Y412MC10]|uniref:Imm41 family immunity protein n=1 Tax=Geobacillus sp. (strain Y412MC10) TaxID=481743 RepID=UPI0001787F26|nr:Imm41 family immunity protein [Paenibacillus sp. Y412MC10]ACX64802.1 conserved hypothetical protein [Paenibacillus sp. Y412MC10]